MILICCTPPLAQDYTYSTIQERTLRGTGLITTTEKKNLKIEHSRGPSHNILGTCRN